MMLSALENGGRWCGDGGRTNQAKHEAITKFAGKMQSCPTLAFGGWVSFDEFLVENRHGGIVFLVWTRGGAASGDG